MVDTHDKDATSANPWLGRALVAFAAVLALGGLIAYYALTTQPGWVRWGALVVGLGLGAGAMSVSTVGRKFWDFVVGSRVELRKMVWPTKEETWKTTAVVFGFVVILGVFFWIVDMLLGWGTRKLLGGGV